MAPLSNEEKDTLLCKVSQVLSETPYACSSLMQLTNGTTNFVFRGELVHPIFDQVTGKTASTVIVKHSLVHAALNKDLLIDASRAVRCFHVASSPKEYSNTSGGITHFHFLT